jgi:hypothetical protein
MVCTKSLRVRVAAPVDWYINAARYLRPVFAEVQGNNNLGKTVDLATGYIVEKCFDFFRVAMADYR